MTTTTIIENNKTFAEFTRVFKVASTGVIKTQPITIALDDVASVRPSNRLGFAQHRSTVTLSNGDSFELSDVYSAVAAELDAIA